MKNMKIFGIGLNKTGTKTFQKCGQILGYNCKSTDHELLTDIKNHNFDNIKKIVHKFNFFEDWPWPLIYAELDVMFPDSKFILTTRKTSVIWFNSLCKHSLTTHPEDHCRKLAYGYDYPQPYSTKHIEFYENHNNKVREYFKDENNFLEVCWEKGDDWAVLCDFLKCDLPGVPFPHENKSKNKKINVEWYMENSKRIINEFLK